MKLWKVLTAFLVLILVSSAASAACYGSSYKYQKHYQQHGCGYGQGCKNKCYPPSCNAGNTCNKGKSCTQANDSGNNAVPPITPTNVTGTTKVKMCRNNVCTVGGNGQVIVLTNYNNATDPTYAQLIDFALQDTTDEKSYSSSYLCGDFARDFHDACEKAGIRAGWVGAYGCNHAFNVFETSDKGTVYIDTTGIPGGSAHQDKQLNVAIGQPLIGNYLYTGQPVTMGCSVKSLLVYW